jgi:hypothetical protein
MSRPQEHDPVVPDRNQARVHAAAAAKDVERRRQVRGLLLLAIAAIVFAILRAGIHNVFTRGWWRLW